MENPHGLSVYENMLFLGEGAYGLKVLNISDPRDVSEVGHLKDIPTYDVIALSNHEIFVIGDGGFYLLDAVNPLDITIMSHIPVSNN